MIATIEAIYRQHRKGLFTLALSITGRAESAEDAVHEAIVRLCRASKAGREPTGDATAYVYAAVRNAAIDQRRKRLDGSGSVLSIFNLAEPLAEPNTSFFDGERDQMVADAIAELPAEQREALVMHLYAGLTFGQSAQTLQLPLQTIASRYRRALSTLRDKLSSLR